MQNRITEGIDYFGRGHWLSAAQARVSLNARRRMFGKWMEFAGGELEGRSILDIGSTPDRERMDSNCMIPWFLETGANVTLYSPENIDSLTDTFPGVKILPSGGFGSKVPAEDLSYDWVTSSAVLEHVGGVDAQIEFIRECARLARYEIFLTTPNRWHWLEFHTKLPLLHWLPRTAHRTALRLLGKGVWAQESHLRLVGRRELAKIATAALGDEWDITIEEVRTLGMRSNLILLARRF